MRWLERLASLKLTLVVLGLLALGVVWAYHSEVRTTWALVLPLVLLALNLVAAIATRPVFRRQGPLLLFHLALLALIALIALGRLTYLTGRVELSEGEQFAGALTHSEAGPWHADRLGRVHFVNEGFTIDYAPEVQRGATRNRVRWWDEDGQEQVAVIGDQTPLVIAGYRFYTSPNKGFAPTFLWAPHAGAPHVGTVHLPSYPMNEFKQANTWTPPGSNTEIWIQLDFDEVLIDPARPSSFRLPDQHRLVVRVGEVRHVITPGGQVELPDGTLHYQGLRVWMGYTVFYDWTVPWLLATCAVGLVALAWFYWRRFAPKPWLEGEVEAPLRRGPADSPAPAASPPAARDSGASSAPGGG